jgi:hypothetical protein
MSVDRAAVMREFNAVTARDQATIRVHLTRLKSAISVVDEDMDRQMAGLQSLQDTREDVSRQIKKNMQASESYAKQEGASVQEAMASVESWLSKRTSEAEEEKLLSARESVLNTAVDEGQGLVLLDQITGALKLDDKAKAVLRESLREGTEKILQVLT